MKSQRRSSIIKELESLSVKVKAEESIIQIMSQPLSRLISLFSLFNNLKLLNKTYYIALANVDNGLYKIVVLVQAIAIISVYLISYSTLNYSIYFNGSKGTNLNFDKKSKCEKIKLAFNLTFLAPLIFILLEVFIANALIIKLIFAINRLRGTESAKGIY